MSVCERVWLWDSDSVSLGDTDDVSVYISICDKVAVAIELRKSLPVLERVWLRDRDSVSLGDTNHISVYIRVCDEVAVAVGVS